MAKPIFLVQCPAYTDRGNIDRVKEKLQNQLTDWHVLIFATEDKPVEYFAFNADKLPDVDIEELKKQLELK